MSIIDDKWKLLFDRYDIEKKVSESGPFYITADQIREYKEPRLMTKFDTRESLPSVFGSRLGILPVTRGTYVIGDFVPVFWMTFWAVRTLSRRYPAGWPPVNLRFR